LDSQQGAVGWRSQVGRPFVDAKKLRDVGVASKVIEITAPDAAFSVAAAKASPVKALLQNLNSSKLPLKKAC
jgi:hypothetical protein